MKSYLLEIKHETITPVSIEANSSQEAIEKALRNEGHSGNSYPGETIVLNVRAVDD